LRAARRVVMVNNIGINAATIGVTNRDMSLRGDSGPVVLKTRK